ncbi:N-(5'-phosphoribosyl)anthranilate isomerase [Bacteroidia bacterium]|nr:N-(5'-phosphoribosyl)anthranilate isomerase [Bacteroidia bacterium]GHT81247.1 N-(5'-phosphoribosyl)anthranilate isomerase [Bacteroidia bacterium]
MKCPQNIADIAALQPDFMGFIFYPKSPRYVGNLADDALKIIPVSTKKIGVFVNEAVENILQTAAQYKLDGIQLHGNESVDVCKRLKNDKLICIKAFSIGSEQDLNLVAPYVSCVDYFLFDTQTPTHGGSGKKFDWHWLDAYHESVPFFLSGGIGSEDAAIISKIKHPQLFGVDVNSKFEIEAGIKNVADLRKFIAQVKLINNAS